MSSFLLRNVPRCAHGKALGMSSKHLMPPYTPYGNIDGHHSVSKANCRPGRHGPSRGEVFLWASINDKSGDVDSCQMIFIYQISTTEHDQECQPAKASCTRQWMRLMGAAIGYKYKRQ